MTQRGLLRMSQYTGGAINLFDPLVKISLVLELYRIYSIVTINEVKFLFSKDLLFFKEPLSLQSVLDFVLQNYTMKLSVSVFLLYCQ